MSRLDLQDELDAAMAKEVEKAAASAAPGMVEDEEEWEYKLTADETAEIHGPFTGPNMQSWMDQG